MQRVSYSISPLGLYAHKTMGFGKFCVLGQPGIEAKEEELSLLLRKLFLSAFKRIRKIRAKKAMIERRLDTESRLNPLSLSSPETIVVFPGFLNLI
jgi:hypothetical protein